MNCCICGKEMLDGGLGNNPAGAIDETKKLITWDAEDRCCNDCNTKHVLPGRMYKFYRVIKNEALVRRGK